jgi:hypothetical protein
VPEPAGQFVLVDFARGDSDGDRAVPKGVRGRKGVLQSGVDHGRDPYPLSPIVGTHDSSSAAGKQVVVPTRASLCDVGGEPLHCLARQGRNDPDTGFGLGRPNQQLPAWFGDDLSHVHRLAEQIDILHLDATKL